MGIEESLRMDADALAREVNAIDEAAVLRRVFASLDVPATVDVGASVPGRPVRAAGPCPGSQPAAAEATGESSDSEVDHHADDAERSPVLSGFPREVRRCIRDAEAGDPSSARRVAELLELAGHDSEAAVWWHLAAKLGDLDAIDYVRDILDGDSLPLEGTCTGSRGWEVQPPQFGAQIPPRHLASDRPGSGPGRRC